VKRAAEGTSANARESASSNSSDGGSMGFQMLAPQ
jgi:hypothetical protein